jgi:carbon storage regulator
MRGELRALVACNTTEGIDVLVLSRTLGEDIIIGEPGPDEIVVRVVSIDRGKIRLGITAPRSVPVNRRELLRKKEASAHDSRPQA